MKGNKVVLREKRWEDATNDYAWRSDDELARAVADLVRTGARTVAPPSLKAQLDENQIAARLLDVYREAVDGRRPAHTS